MIQLLTLDSPCDEAVRQATAALLRAGLQIASSFNLQSARAAHLDCPCLNHGTAACDCQMIVLLVYGPDERPATLVGHGHDGYTWLSLADDPEGRPSPQLEATILTTLVPQNLLLP